MYTYKIHIFIDAYNIIIKYDKSCYTYIKIFNKITLKCLLYSNYINMRFSLHFYEFLTILSLLIFFSKISADISVKSKYRYIRDYRYFHPWLRHTYDT